MAPYRSNVELELSLSNKLIAKLHPVYLITCPRKTSKQTGVPTEKEKANSPLEKRKLPGRRTNPPKPAIKQINWQEPPLPPTSPATREPADRTTPPSSPGRPFRDSSNTSSASSSHAFPTRAHRKS